MLLFSGLWGVYKGRGNHERLRKGRFGCIGFDSGGVGGLGILASGFRGCRLYA